MPARIPSSPPTPGAQGARGRPRRRSAHLDRHRRQRRGLPRDPGHLQHNGPGMFAIRAVLAATMSPAWGMYCGYELFEHRAVREGSEEYLDCGGNDTVSDHPVLGWMQPRDTGDGHCRRTRTFDCAPIWFNIVHKSTRSMPARIPSSPPTPGAQGARGRPRRRGAHLDRHGVNAEGYREILGIPVRPPQRSWWSSARRERNQPRRARRRSRIAIHSNGVLRPHFGVLRLGVLITPTGPARSAAAVLRWPLRRPRRCCQLGLRPARTVADRPRPAQPGPGQDLCNVPIADTVPAAATAMCENHNSPGFSGTVRCPATGTGPNGEKLDITEDPTRAARHRIPDQRRGRGA